MHRITRIIFAPVIIAATFGLLSSAIPASAGLIDITYDLTAPTFGPIGAGDGIIEIDHPLVAAGVTMNVSAHDFTSGGGVITSRNDARITSPANGQGAGVSSDSDGGGVSGRTDGLGLDELLSFAFFRGGNPIKVQLIEAVFQTFNDPGRVRLFIDNQNISITTLFGVPNNIVQQFGTGSNPFSLDFEPFSLSGNLIEFGTKTNPSEWRLVSLTVRVPEPGMLALFGFGLAALGFARRRKAA